MENRKMFPSLIAGIAAATILMTCKTSAHIPPEPYLMSFASIIVNGEPKCSAAIIDDYHVMSSNSCIGAAGPSDVLVRVGTNKLNHRGSTYAVNSFKSFNISYFRYNDSLADFTMLQVNSSFFPYVHMTGYANPNIDGVKENQTLTLLGWENPREKGSPLTSTQMSVMSAEECSKIYNKSMSRNEYCLMPEDNKINPCMLSLGTPCYGKEQYNGMLTTVPTCSDSTDLPKPAIMTAIYRTTDLLIIYLCDIMDMLS